MTNSARKETVSRQTPSENDDDIVHLDQKNKELARSAYERNLDEFPCFEEIKKIVDEKKGRRFKVPQQAYVHETADFVQLNCCLTPWCANFHKDCLTEVVSNGNSPGSFQLSPGYSFASVKDTNRKDLEVPALKCDSCGFRTRFYSNRSASELMSRLTRKYAPALFCGHCSCSNMKATGEENCCYYWDYANPSPETLFKRHYSHRTTGAQRLICRTCGKTKSPYWNSFPSEFSDIEKEPEKYVRILHEISTLSFNDYRRSYVYDKRLVPVVNPSNPRLGNSYYSALRKYQFIAVEWIGYYNNQIRYGKANIKPIAERKTRNKKPGVNVKESKIISGGDVYEEDTELSSISIPSDIAEKYIPYFTMPQIQTDTLMLSTHTPGEDDKRQELRLIISVLVPSGHILLATLNFSDQYNFSDLKKLDKKSNSPPKRLDIHGDDRELSIHAHNEKKRDHYVSPDRGVRGRLNPIDFDGKGVCLRQPYHSISHFYVLEKIVSRIPELMLVQDMEKDALKSCVWAFRNRIAKKTCHVITSQEEKRKEFIAWAEKERMKSNEKLTKKLEEKVKIEIANAKNGVNPKHISTTKNYAFISGIFAQVDGGSKPRRKTWVSRNTLAEMDSMNATMMLRGASLFVVDSLCNQFRKRVRGLHRGLQTAKNSERSYVSHWKNPLIVQQLADVFVFSKNCLAWHSTKEGYLPSTVQMGLSIPNRHLIHHICSPRISSDEFVEEKYLLRKQRASRRRK